MRLVRSACLRGDPGPQPLRYASVNGRQLFALARDWPELADAGRRTGVYHAVGRERIQVMEAAFDILTTRGFDALRPASMIFEHMSLGPPAQLAITLGCRGPFFSFEADALAGAIALQQALEDLEEGRCEQVLVASYVLDPPASWLLLLDGAGPLAWRFRHVFGMARPDAATFASLAGVLGGQPALEGVHDPDPHGLAALAAAMEKAAGGQPASVWAHMPDGRGILAGFGIPPGSPA